MFEEAKKLEIHEEADQLRDRLGKVEAALRTAEQKCNKLEDEREIMLKSIIDYSPALIFIRDLDERYVFVNSAYRENGNRG